MQKFKIKLTQNRRVQKKRKFRPPHFIMFEIGAEPHSCGSGRFWTDWKFILTFFLATEWATIITRALLFESWELLLTPQWRSINSIMTVMQPQRCDCCNACLVLHKQRAANFSNFAATRAAHFYASVLHICYSLQTGCYILFVSLLSDHVYFGFGKIWSQMRVIAFSILDRFCVTKLQFGAI